MRKGGHAPFISFGVYSSIQKVEDIYISNAPLELLLQGLFYMMAAILYMWSTVATKPQNLWPAPFRAWKGGLNWWPSGVGHAATPCMWRARDSVGISKLSAKLICRSWIPNTIRMPLCKSGIGACMTFLLHWHRQKQLGRLTLGLTADSYMIK